MQRLKSAERAQQFLSAHSMTYGQFCPRRHLRAAGEDRGARTKALRISQQDTRFRTAS